jgi:hypothetical protein
VAIAVERFFQLVKAKYADSSSVVARFGDPDVAAPVDSLVLLQLLLESFVGLVGLVNHKQISFLPSFHVVQKRTDIVGRVSIFEFVGRDCPAVLNNLGNQFIAELVSRLIKVLLDEFIAFT